MEGKVFIGKALLIIKMETVTIPMEEYKELEQENIKLKSEVETLRNTKLYQRLLDCLENISKKEFTRKDLGI